MTEKSTDNQNPTVAPRAFRIFLRVYGVLTLSDYDELRPQISRPTCIIDRRPTFDVRLKNVLSRDPPPELLLITNDCGRR